MENFQHQVSIEFQVILHQRKQSKHSHSVYQEIKHRKSIFNTLKNWLLINCHHQITILFPQLSAEMVSISQLEIILTALDVGFYLLIAIVDER